MLLDMHIRNIALIDSIDISLKNNMNIMTGETGAGKSIIIGSLAIGLGGKFNKELLREQEKDGLVELIFSIDNVNIQQKLSKLGVETEEGQLIISRRLVNASKTINRINDETVTLTKLKGIAAILIDLHAQHEQQTLLKVSKHLEIIDSFGGEEVEIEKEKVSKLYSEYVGIYNQINANNIDETERNRKIDFLKYQINEIDNAKLVGGEDEQLEKQYKKIVNSRSIIETVSNIYKLTSDSSDNMSKAMSELKRIMELDEDIQNFCEMLYTADGMINDFNSEINRYMEEMDFNEQEYAEIESRLDLINSLKSKYGNTINDIVDSCVNYREECKKLEDSNELILQLKKDLECTKTKLDEACECLSIKRKSYAERLCGLIVDSLRELNFSNVEFTIEFTKNDTYSANGVDKARFMISTNIGESIKPLDEVASGGELSRIMLAIKSCLANADDTPTLIFDEIDVGISGATAQMVGEKMRKIAKYHQVICITHLPQIASAGDVNYKIEKHVENNKTITTIRELDSKEQINEIARLIGGAAITESVLQSAREMKGLADRTKIY